MSTSGTTPAPAQAYPLSNRVALEGLGSFFIVFAGLATALFSPAGSAATIGFAYGLALVACLISFGHVTNGFFNPAFSLAMAVAGRIKWLAAVLYIVAQTIGGLLATAVLVALMKVMPAGATPETPKLFAALANGFDSHSPSQVPMVGVLIVEIVLMAVLVAVVLGASSARNKSTMGPIGIGLAFAVAVTITMPLSNGSLNPARATSVIFLADSWALGQVWLFWLAPLFGAALAAAIYRSFAPARSLVTVDGPAEDIVATGTQDIDSDADTDDDDDNAALPKPVPAVPEPVTSDPAPKKNDAQDFFDSKDK
ncbi:aquaporin [Arthrobacter sp. GMC3]|uniref:aquaporin n=1 Tax=Arthrobacter sp. GMC3 TaxID=2058894 RepID=UPI000CE3C4C1|nr:aquaporin [Arthrobacter sp. GMC3]